MLAPDDLFAAKANVSLGIDDDDDEDEDEDDDDNGDDGDDDARLVSDPLNSLPVEGDFFLGKNDDAFE